MPVDPTWNETRARMHTWLVVTGESYGSNGPVDSVTVENVLEYWDEMVRRRPELVRILGEIHAEDTRS
ncbi:MAG TPA: hypothetical protein VGJ13_05175 [Pseudonocardiaceae bacterium]